MSARSAYIRLLNHENAAKRIRSRQQENKDLQKYIKPGHEPYRKGKKS